MVVGIAIGIYFLIALSVGMTVAYRSKDSTANAAMDGALIGFAWPSFLFLAALFGPFFLIAKARK